MFFGCRNDGNRCLPFFTYFCLALFFECLNLEPFFYQFSKLSIIYFFMFFVETLTNSSALNMAQNPTKTRLLAEIDIENRRKERSRPRKSAQLPHRCTESLHRLWLQCPAGRPGVRPGIGHSREDFGTRYIVTHAHGWRLTLSTQIFIFWGKNLSSRMRARKCHVCIALGVVNAFHM